MRQRLTQPPSVCGAAPACQEGTPGDVVMFVADDLGWNDVGWRNPALRTPTIDALRLRGVTLTNYCA